ncbi:ArsR family transcriptional regulator [Rheinheimera riviphila]|uniref:ArsR family transcriptional regulator n=1 Tax=Rheinheimera riviphila TaxID=1834037 RepID=A0A437QLK3_9GAMM|nr:ArsR family transcriptional regulator [Rheinheimera riviphila]
MSDIPSLLFVCSENSARSVMAEAVAKNSYRDRFRIFSAGSNPGTVDLRALAALKRQGIAADDSYSKAIHDLPQQQFDYAILLCDKARQQCASQINAKYVLAWDFPDPKLDPEPQTFDRTLHEISERLKMFVLLYDKALLERKPALPLAPLEFFKLLADETRLASLLLIAHEGELCVCELETALVQTQPKISRHLAMLRKSQLLIDRRQGQWVFYRLHPALPAWASQSIELTLQQNPQLLAPLIANLETMGNRPARAAACCD